MRILEYGTKGRPVLMLIHGFESPYQIWDSYIRHYEDRYHLIVPVLTGHEPDGWEDFESFDKCAEELEDYCASAGISHIHAVYGMSMGGVMACVLWRNKHLSFDHVIMESSPLSSYSKFMTSYLTRYYLSVTHAAQQRDTKIVEQAVGTMVTREQLGYFLDLIDNISDTTIVNYLREIGRFRLPEDIDTPDTKVTYFYGSKLSEFIFRFTAKRIARYYKNSEIICLKGKGHCEDALFSPDVMMERMDAIIG